MQSTLEGVLDDLGRRLAELRRALGWTQAEAAEKLSTLLRDYQALEAGSRNVTVQTVVALARVFGVPVRALFDPPATRQRRQVGRPVQASGKRLAREKRKSRRKTLKVT